MNRRKEAFEARASKWTLLFSDRVEEANYQQTLETNFNIPWCFQLITYGSMVVFAFARIYGLIVVLRGGIVRTATFEQELGLLIFALFTFIVEGTLKLTKRFLPLHGFFFYICIPICSFSESLFIQKAPFFGIP